jgi:hypothetical protein
MRSPRTKDPALRVNGAGSGPVSAEWLIPKSLWIKETQRELFDRAEKIGEYQRSYFGGVSRALLSLTKEGGQNGEPYLPQVSTRFPSALWVSAPPSR